jgi:hypothetical protein
MARAIKFLALLLPAGLAAQGIVCPSTADADPSLQRQYVEFKQSVESGPLLRSLGQPTSCTTRIEAGSIWVTYEFPNQGKLQAHRDPRIELTEQELTQPGLSQQTALTLLRRTERWAFGSKGCRISWGKQPSRHPGAASNTFELAYRGEVCNCQGRLLYVGDRLAGVSFRSAC